MATKTALAPPTDAPPNNAPANDASTNSATTDALISRRGVFMKLGILFNALAATVVAVPIVGFLFSSITRGRERLSLLGARWKGKRIS